MPFRNYLLTQLKYRKDNKGPKSRGVIGTCLNNQYILTAPYSIAFQPEAPQQKKKIILMQNKILVLVEELFSVLIAWGLG